jgi:hypothetical protein
VGEARIVILSEAKDDTGVTKAGRYTKIVPVFHVHSAEGGGSDYGAIGSGGP